MPRKLKDIDVEEISLVDVPANRKKFLIIKKDMQRLLQKEGDPDIDKLEVNKGMKELKELLKDFLGEDFKEEEFEKAEKELSKDEQDALKGALNILNKYKGDFPDELKDAVKVLGKRASYSYPVKKEDLEKLGAKLSKTTQEELKKIQAIIEKLLEPKEGVKKDDDATVKGLEEIKKFVEELKKAKDEDPAVKKITDMLQDYQKRLEVVEKAKGIKKSLNGDGKEKVEKKEFEWTLGKLLDGEEE